MKVEHLNDFNYATYHKFSNLTQTFSSTTIKSRRVEFSKKNVFILKRNRKTSTVKVHCVIEKSKKIQNWFSIPFLAQHWFSKKGFGFQIDFGNVKFFKNTTFCVVQIVAFVIECIQSQWGFL